MASTSRLMATWSQAFEDSRKIGISSDEQISDFLESAREEGKSGAFCQPPLLAAFVTMLSGTTSAAASATADFEKITAEIQDTKNVGDSLTKQICRKWLKHTFLGLGTECSEGSDACPRKHDLPPNLNLLYKDYSFKGLTSQQRKKIIAKAQAGGDAEVEREKTASSVTQAEKRKRKETDAEWKEKSHGTEDARHEKKARKEDKKKKLEKKREQ